MLTLPSIIENIALLEQEQRITDFYNDLPYMTIASSQSSKSVKKGLKKLARATWFINN